MPSQKLLQPDLVKHSSESLWQQFLGGNQEAFELLFYGNNKVLLNYLIGLTKNVSLAEDLCQSTWLKLLEKRDNSIKNFKAYLFRTARNTFIDYCRGLQQRRDKADMTGMNEREINPWEVEEWMEFLRCVLSKFQLEVWLLYLEGFNNKEISEKLEKSQQRIANIKSEVRRKIIANWE